MATGGGSLPTARPGERGQATVEFALLLPVLVLALLAVLQVAFVVRDQVAVVHAAREAARAASVDPDPGRESRWLTGHCQARLCMSVLDPRSASRLPSRSPTRRRPTSRWSARSFPTRLLESWCSREHRPVAGG